MMMEHQRISMTMNKKLISNQHRPSSNNLLYKEQMKLLNLKILSMKKAEKLEIDRCFSEDCL